MFPNYIVFMRCQQIAAVQNAIVEPTTAKLTVQRDALHARIAKFVEAAAASSVNIICFQEAWSMLTTTINQSYLKIGVSKSILVFLF